MTASKIVAAAASGAGSDPVDIDDIFSVDLYEGTGRYSGTRAEQTITNGIDFSTEGGMLLVQGRGTGTGNGARSPIFSTPELGVGNFLYGTANNAKNSDQSSTYANTGPNQYNTDGFKLGDERDGWGAANDLSTPDYVSYSFRKAKKFFDIVTWTGNSTAGRQIAHNLGSVPGMIWVKGLSLTSDWTVYHRGVDASNPEQYRLYLNTTAARVDQTNPWNDTAPTATHFTLGTDSYVNASGNTYIAYIFAHNNNDGEFGPDGDQDVIKCGSYTGSGAAGKAVNVGFEPQFVFTKRADGLSSWIINNSMTGLAHTGTEYHVVDEQTGASTSSTANMKATSSGFEIDSTGSGYNSNGSNYVYMAIRRGPLAVPEDATKVFDVNYSGSSNIERYSTGFDSDLNINTDASQNSSNYLLSRLVGRTYLNTATNDQAASYSAGIKAFSEFNDKVNIDSGFWGNTDYIIGWDWRRAPGYFDVVIYKGNDTAGRTIAHNLGVVPEMMWVKKVNGAKPWLVYHKDLAAQPAQKYLQLEESDALIDDISIWNDTAPTSSVFTVGDSNNHNGTSTNQVALLFASAPGVSKVGNYTGTGNSNITVDCGFSSGARFVLIKRTDASGSWWVADTERGLVSGNDHLLELDTASQQITNYNMVEPSSSGFIVNGGSNNDNSWNASGGAYIFYAIA